MYTFDDYARDLIRIAAIAELSHPSDKEVIELSTLQERTDNFEKSFVKGQNNGQ